MAFHKWFEGKTNKTVWQQKLRYPCWDACHTPCDGESCFGNMTRPIKIDYGAYDTEYYKNKTKFE